MFQLRPYQEMIIEGNNLEFDKGLRRILDQAPCGAGKTVMWAYMASKARLKGNRSLFVVHRQELIEQSAATLQDAGIPFGVVAAGYPTNYDELIQIGSIQTLIRRLDKMPAPIIIFPDECFVAGTMVGGRPIEHLQVGDQVPCFDEETGEITQSTVTHIFKNPAPAKLISLSVGGQNITCTPTHPVFTPTGWRMAGYLKEGDSVYAHLPTLWRTDEGQESEALPGLLPPRHDRAQSPGCAGEDAGAQPDDGPERPREDDRHPSADQPQAAGSRGERYGTYSTPTSPSSEALLAAYGICGIDKRTERFWIPTELQNRHCEPGTDDCHRGGWRVALRPGASATGCQEDRFLEVARVDRVEVFESGDPERFAGVCPDGHVYNIEVAAHNTYFANGLAVHNCHHAAAATWRKLLDAYPDVYVIGFTATPARMGGQGLGDIFQSLILGPTVRELVAWGNLAPFKYFAPPVAANLEGMRVKMGDFVQSDVALRMDKSEIIGDLIQHYQRLAPGARAVCYCASVAHSQHTAEMFRLADIPALHIDGETHDAVRRAATVDFKSGKIKVLCNVDLISEGFDCPGMDAVILARPTQSLTLYIQQSMRPMRPDKENPGKVALILDHVGNVYRHGLPDEDREWSLEGTKKKSAGAAAEFPLRQCPRCYAAHRPTPVCPQCGHVYQAEERAEPEQKDGALSEVLDIERDKKLRRMEIGRARSVVTLEEIAMRRGYSPHWVRRMCDVKGIPFGNQEAR